MDSRIKIVGFMIGAYIYYNSRKERKKEKATVQRVPWNLGETKKKDSPICVDFPGSYIKAVWHECVTDAVFQYPEDSVPKLKFCLASEFLFAMYGICLRNLLCTNPNALQSKVLCLIRNMSMQCLIIFWKRNVFMKMAIYQMLTVCQTHKTMWMQNGT